MTLLKMSNIRLNYGPSKALNGVDFHLEAGEVHALIGEHRAGKTSLMRVLAGAVRPDHGEIVLNSAKHSFARPVDAMNAGIGMVHQNLQIIPPLNTVENVYGRQLPHVWIGYKRYGRYVEQVRKLLAGMGLVDIDLWIPAGRLPEAQQQMVEIARIVALNPQILILDEVSHRLNQSEMERLLEIIHRFRDSGRAVVYVTQNLNEVFEIADRVTVLSNGHRKSTNVVGELDRLKLVRIAFNLALEQREDPAAFGLSQFSETVIRDLPIGVLIFDDQDTVFQANEEAGRLCGREASDLAGLQLGEILDRNMTVHRQEVLDAVRDRAQRRWDSVEFGQARFARVQTNTIRDADHRILGRVLLVQDAILDDSINEYLARAEKMQSTAALAAGVAHEINNPLATIRNFVELLKLKEVEDAKLDKLQRISAEMDRIVEIVSSLLSFSRVRPESRQPMDIIALAREVVTLLGHRIRRSSLDLNVVVPDEPITINADENRIKQVLINVLANSIEATLDGDTVTLSVSRIEAAEAVRITVRDSGSGIPESARDQIFQPFYTTKASKTSTGLGLSICKHIVESHGGRIDVESTPGEFTEFRIVLPVSGPTPRE